MLSNSSSEKYLGETDFSIIERGVNDYTTIAPTIVTSDGLGTHTTTLDLTSFEIDTGGVEDVSFAKPGFLSHYSKAQISDRHLLTTAPSVTENNGNVDVSQQISMRRFGKSLMLSNSSSGEHPGQSDFRTIENREIIATIIPNIVTSDAPGTHTTTPGVTSFGINTDGVADVILTKPDFLARCSGTRISDRHLLTAAHCVTDDNGSVDVSQAEITWELEGKTVTTIVQKSEITVHPNYDGNLLNGYDAAILEFEPIDSEVPQYDFNRDTNDIGQQVVQVGYGRSGFGSVGSTISSGVKRAGLNKFDATAEYFVDLGLGGFLNAQTQLIADFDSGLSDNDAFSFFDSTFPVDLGFDNDEVVTAPGDSGGSTFNHQGEIIGIHSYGLRLEFNDGSSSDVDSELNSSWGEFSGSARVSSFADWIKEVINTPPVATNDNYTVTEGDILFVKAPVVLANDIDPDGDSLIATLVQEPSNGRLIFNQDGSFKYRPDDDFEGTDIFSYIANDGFEQSNLATVTISVRDNDFDRGTPVTAGTVVLRRCNGDFYDDNYGFDSSSNVLISSGDF